MKPAEMYRNRHGYMDSPPEQQESRDRDTPVLEVVDSGSMLSTMGQRVPPPLHNQPVQGQEFIQGRPLAEGPPPPPPPPFAVRDGLGSSGGAANMNEFVSGGRRPVPAPHPYDMRLPEAGSVAMETPMYNAVPHSSAGQQRGEPAGSYSLFGSEIGRPMMQGDVGQRVEVPNQGQLLLHKIQQQDMGTFTTERIQQQLLQQQRMQHQLQFQQQYRPVQEQPQYRPVQEQQQYRPVQEQHQYRPVQEQQQYRPVQEQQQYRPVQEQQQYRPVQEQQQYRPVQEQQQYRPVQEQQQYIPVQQQQQLQLESIKPQRLPVQYRQQQQMESMRRVEAQHHVGEAHVSQNLMPSNHPDLHKQDALDDLLKRALRLNQLQNNGMEVGHTPDQVGVETAAHAVTGSEKTQANAAGTHGDTVAYKSDAMIIPTRQHNIKDMHESRIADSDSDQVEKEIKPSPGKHYVQQRQNRWVDIMDHKHNGRQPIGSMSELNAKLLNLAEQLSPTEEDVRSWEEAFDFVRENLLSIFGDEVHVIRFGSTANGLSVRSSNDIDVSVQIPYIQEGDTDEYERVIVEVGELFEKLQVEELLVLAKARVPVVKFTYPKTGTRVDITVNNTLACLNTKLLADYCAIDIRLPQLVSIVKHWSKQRKVNDPYQGTLSSYCYVLMCIFHLQTRNPPILPVLQALPPTVSKQVGEWKVEYNDNVDHLKGFGKANKQMLSDLVWEFFEYWAWKHDYNNNVISIRKGHLLKKEEKEWTKRIGRDRHLLCVEDPFFLSHDLGRTVDKQSKDVLRKEFFRAATILRDYSYPELQLFAPFIARPQKLNRHT